MHYIWVWVEFLLGSPIGLGTLWLQVGTVKHIESGVSNLRWTKWQQLSAGVRTYTCDTTCWWQWFTKWHIHSWESLPDPGVCTGALTSSTEGYNFQPSRCRINKWHAHVLVVYAAKCPCIFNTAGEVILLSCMYFAWFSQHPKCLARCRKSQLVLWGACWQQYCSLEHMYMHANLYSIQ